MLKKFWNHQITVGDYITVWLVSVAACVPYLVWLYDSFGLLDEWKEGVKKKFRKLKRRFF